MTLSLSVSAEIDAVAAGWMGDGLNAFNDAVVGYADRLPLQVLGGIVGWTSLGLLFIDTVYVSDALRGQGIGARMLALAEAEGFRRGATMSAPAFALRTAIKADASSTTMGTFCGRNI